MALADNHPLASEALVRLADLRTEQFVGVPEKDMPGRNQWFVQVCRRAKFRLRGIVDSDGLTHGLATIVRKGGGE